MRYTIASDPAWCTCSTLRGWQQLGPVSSLRCSVLWFTGHHDKFFLTEGPCLAKKWKLDVMTSDGILLQPAAQEVWPIHRRAMRLLVKPHEPAAIVSVEVGSSALGNKVPVCCTTMAGNVLLEKNFQRGSTFFDITKSLAFPLSSGQVNVKLLCGDKLVGRSFFHHDLTKPVPDEKLELEFMNVEYFASATWMARENQDKKDEKIAGRSKVSTVAVKKNKLKKKPAASK